MPRRTPKFTGSVDTVVPKSRANGSHFGVLPVSGCRVCGAADADPATPALTDRPTAVAPASNPTATLRAKRDEPIRMPPFKKKADKSKRMLANTAGQSPVKRLGESDAPSRRKSQPPDIAGTNTTLSYGVAHLA